MSSSKRLLVLFMNFTYKDIEKLQKRGLSIKGISKQDLEKKSKEQSIPIGKLFIENKLKENGIDYVQEKRFSGRRKFRLDYFFEYNGASYGVEYEGIFAVKKDDSGDSRHTTYDGYTKDCTKYNMATLSEIKVLRYTAKNYKDFSIDLNSIIHGCK